jgi:DNA-binding transcriptional regulator YbjK
MNARFYRQKPEDRQQMILDAALMVAKREGLEKLKRETVAKEANVSCGLVNRYFNTMPQLKRAVIRAAIHAERPILEIIAQALVQGDAQAKKAPQEVKDAALKLYMSR